MQISGALTTRAVRVTIPYLIENKLYGSRPHGLLIKIGSRSLAPHTRGDRRTASRRRTTFEALPSGVSRPMCSCMLEWLRCVGYRNGWRGFAIFRVFRRLWIPLVILVVIASGGFTVTRLHSVFGSEKRASYADTKTADTKPFNPKHLTYEVFGPPGTVATISYFDVNADPQRVENAHLPWSLEFATTEATAVGSIVAQGDSNSIGCRIVVDGEVKAERVSNEVNAFTFCLLKAA